MRRATWRLPASATAGLLAGALLIPFDWTLAGIVDAVLAGRAPPGRLLPALAWALALLVLRATLLSSAEMLAGLASVRVTSVLRQALFRTALRHRPDWTAARTSGGLAAAVVDQVSAFDGYVARYVPSAVLACALPLAYIGAVTWADRVAGALLLLTAPLIPVFMALVGWGAQAAHARHQEAFGRLSGLFADRLRGMLTLKLLGRAEDEADHLHHVGEELRSRTAEVLRLAFLSTAVLEFFAALGVAGVALYVGLRSLGFLHLAGAPLGLQAGLFCLLLAPEVYAPLRQLALHHHDRAAVKAAVATIAATFGPVQLDRADEPLGSAPAGTGGPATLSLTDVTIRSPDDGKVVLCDVSLTIAAGDRVAVTGLSGSGKSTLVEALAGLRGHGGDLRLDARRVSTLPDAVFRSRVAVLAQRPHLFRGTIADNIRFGRADASDGAVRDAAVRAGVTRFTDRLRLGLDTPLGEAGMGCSGGEALRIALARIYLGDPGLLLLDEPTAHLDPETEVFVLDGLLAFATGRTLVVATHSPAVVRRMGRVLRIEGRSLLPALPRLSAAGARRTGTGR